MITRRAVRIDPTWLPAVVLLLAAVLGTTSPPAAAHRGSDSYLRLERAGARWQGRWDIAIRDLEQAIGVDGDGDGAVTWGELRGRHGAIAAYALARLDVRTSAPCPLHPREQRVAERTDGTYAVILFDLDCPAHRELRVGYRLLFDLDPTHRGLLAVVDGERNASAVLSPAEPSFTATEAGPGPSILARYLREGVRHIWLGADHLLFLLTLLLPAVLHRDGRTWRGVASLSNAAWETAAVVTAFTAAHALTLCAATLGGARLPAPVVETLIALTVLLAALNNLWPVIVRRRAAIAFGLGLVHGLGFAAALGELGLPAGGYLAALLGFNLGVELGQLLIVAAVVPVAYALRETWLYRQAVLRAGSVGVALVAGVWMVERALAVRLIT